MPDSNTTNLNMTKPEVGASRDTWGTKWNANADILDAIFAAAGTGTAVGLKLAAGKVWNALAGTFNLAASVLYLKDATDNTKVAQFDASNITAGQTRTYKLPDESDWLATRNFSRITGEVKSGYFGSSAPAGWLFVDGKTIGDAASGATARANADCEDLFTLLWTYTSLTVSGGGRGASASADWEAHKTIALPDHRGKTMAALDNLGGTNASVLSASGIATTTRAATGGAATEAAGVSGSCSVSVSVGVVGTTAGSIGIIANVAGNSGVANTGQGNGFNYAVAGDSVSGITSGALTVSATGTGSGSGSISGATATVTNAQPTVMVDQIIAL
jgi:hypothetical protein